MAGHFQISCKCKFPNAFSKIKQGPKFSQVSKFERDKKRAMEEGVQQPKR